MDFEELKVIWDTQNEEPLYAVNETGLHAALQRKSQEFKRSVFWRDVREIGIGLAAGAGFLFCGSMLAFGDYQWLGASLMFEVPVTPWDGVAMFIAAGLWLHYAIYMYAGRKRQERRERQYTSSLRGDLDREIAQTEYQITMARNVLWWGLLPIWTAATLFMLVVLRLAAKSGWLLLLVSIAFLMAFFLDLRCKQRPIKRELLPRKRELESLRRKLADSET